MGAREVTERVCPYCGYIYDENVGDPAHDIPPGTSWDALPDDWECPSCGGEKSAFIIE